MHRRVKKIITLALIFTILVFHTAYGLETTKLEDIGVRLKALGLMIGDPDGNMRFQDNITRAEFAAVSVRLIGKESAALQRKGKTKFQDVPSTHWSTGHINIAVENGLIRGYEDGTFRLNRNITHGEAITILVNALGYGSKVQGTDWPNNFIHAATELGLTKDVAIKAETPATRGDIAVMLHNSLTIPLGK
ncbi:S-layer homology domain-containing protein [Thermotalea metallivorans]|uniref:Surface layer protein n=1 Tax=Thermotalea metallivorans TaxID=520762 RepID=A0A140L6N7_9FIRM|nr:S-layer homology domain-containing protein [Thermotalea metallivorans]KXG76212.1 Surface layer protein [Thermotalea metallivorans]